MRLSRALVSCCEPTACLRSLARWGKALHACDKSGVQSASVLSVLSLLLMLNDQVLQLLSASKLFAMMLLIWNTSYAQYSVQACVMSGKIWVTTGTDLLHGEASKHHRSLAVSILKAMNTTL